MSTETPQQAAIKAIAYHARREAAGEGYRSCRLYIGDDGPEDSGPPERRCWLIPGHQCDCMTERKARALVRSHK